MASIASILAVGPSRPRGALATLLPTVSRRQRQATKMSVLTGLMRKVYNVTMAQPVANFTLRLQTTIRGTSVDTLRPKPKIHPDPEPVDIVG